MVEIICIGNLSKPRCTYLSHSLAFTYRTLTLSAQCSDSVIC